MKTVSMGLGQALLHSHLKISIRLFPKCELLGSDEVRQGGACQRGFRTQIPSNSGFIQDLAILTKNLGGIVTGGIQILASHILNWPITIQECVI